MKSQVQTAINGSFGAIAGSFVMDSLQHMIVWLIVMFSVIMCDLTFGIRKRLILNEEIRISKAIRDTMGKMVTYFSFVVMVVMMSEATNNDKIALWGVLAVCGVEIISIAGNILRPKGYDINISAVIIMLAKKIFSIDKEYSEGIIEKKKDNEILHNERTDE